jgi:hypothetical protein
MTKQPSLPQASRPDGLQPSDAACNAAEGATGTEVAPSFDVGYGKPPAHTQFKPGQSGNKKGRPKGHRNVRTVVKETLNEKIKVKEGDQIRSLTKFEGIVRTMVNSALNRDAKAQASVMALLRSVGMMDEVPEASNAEPFTANDDVILADYLRRSGAGSKQPDGPQDKEATVASTSPVRRTAS